MIEGQEDVGWDEWRALAACIMNDKPSPITGAYGRHVVACVEAAHRAGELGMLG